MKLKVFNAKVVEPEREIFLELEERPSSVVLRLVNYQGERLKGGNLLELLLRAESGKLVFSKFGGVGTEFVETNPAGEIHEV